MNNMENNMGLHPEPIEQLDSEIKLEKNSPIEAISQMTNTELIQLVANFRGDVSEFQELALKEMTKRGLETVGSKE
ncbi:MAG TPA: hypothetical protein VFD55_02320 [Candidatus Angelobacter sp.]|nr:hypothetical protein [Candidatus Angelobacter sp.]